MTKTVAVKGQDGTVRLLHFTLFSSALDLKEAVRKACEEYRRMGRISEDVPITWESFWNEVSNVTCRKYGFYKQKSEVIENTYLWDEPVS